MKPGEKKKGQTYECEKCSKVRGELSLLLLLSYSAFLCAAAGSCLCSTSSTFELQSLTVLFSSVAGLPSRNLPLQASLGTFTVFSSTARRVDPKEMCREVSC